LKAKNLNSFSKVFEILGPKDTDGAMRYDIAIATIKPGGRTPIHYIDHSEVLYIIEGEGIVHLRKQNVPPEKEEMSHVTKDQTVFIPPKDIQYIENVGSGVLKLLAIVDPFWRQEIDHKIEE